MLKLRTGLEAKNDNWNKYKNEKLEMMKNFNDRIEGFGEKGRNIDYKNNDRTDGLENKC